MVKIHIKNERLYLERAGKETELESVTIYHDRKEGTYKITIFPGGKNYTQKTYPIPGITLKQVKEYETIVENKKSMRGIYYHLKSKNFYINYYLK